MCYGEGRESLLGRAPAQMNEKSEVRPCFSVWTHRLDNTAVKIKTVPAVSVCVSFLSRTGLVPSFHKLSMPLSRERFEYHGFSPLLNF